MRKELVWAGIIGITFGLVIGFGAWRVHSSVTSKSEATPTPKPQVESGKLSIAINSPSDFGVVTTSPIAVSGITRAGGWVIVSTEEGDYLTQAETDGAFSVDAELVAGINSILATAINSQGEVISQEITAVYSASFQTNLEESNSSTGEASLDKEVGQRIALAENPPKAYVGTVTDIAESTIQIKTKDSQIQQIATGVFDITVVNTTGTTNKTVNISDIAIGDFVVAMGYVDGDRVLDAQRILIAESSTKNKLSVSLKKVESVSKKTLTLTPIAGGESEEITSGATTTFESYSEGDTKTIKITSISVDDILLIVSDITGSPSVIRSIFDLGTN